MPVYERLSMVVSLTLIGLALYFVIEFPTRLVELTIFGSPVEIVASTRALMVVLLGGLAFTGAGAVVHAHPRQRTGYIVPFWVNAMLLVILATLLLAQLGGALAWAIGLGGTGVLLWFTILAEYRAIDPISHRLNWATLWSQGMSYALMLIFSILIFQANMATPLKVLGLATLSGFQAASIFKLYAAGKPYRLFGLLVALSLGQLAWVWNYFPVSPIQVGLLMLLVFYVLCGLIITHLNNALALSKRVVIEYATVVVVGLILIRWLETL